MPSADHTFTGEADRARLESEVLEWLGELTLPAAASPAPAISRRPAAVAHAGR